MMIHPLDSRIVIEPDAAPKSQGGIVLPENIGEKGIKTGLVVAVGRGRVLESGQIVPVAVKVGDRVLYSFFGGTEIGDLGGPRLTVVNETEVIGVVK